jgi:hypothetical protein
MIGPDFSTVDRAAAEQMYRAGQLEPMYLLPPIFGGADIPENVVFVPVGLAAAKAGFDENVIAPLVREGRVDQYAATPRYEGRSFIPIAVDVVAGPVRQTINIWGSALESR